MITFPVRCEERGTEMFYRELSQAEERMKPARHYPTISWSYKRAIEIISPMVVTAELQRELLKTILFTFAREAG